MFIVFIRTAILYTLVVIVMRIMGKRQIGELQPYEFVITIMISDLASLPMQDTRFPLLLGVIPIITLLFMKTLLSLFELKSQFVRRFIDGEPCILVYNSKINYQGLKKQQINIDELMEEIRLAGYFDLEEIQYAVLENNGQLSILSKNPNSSNNSGNNTSNSNSKPPLLPKIVITDGKINTNSLTSINKDKEWIERLLKRHNLNSISDVLIAMYDTEGNFKYQLYDDYEKECKK
ncbi:DUF421 domain-containing protein [Clostridium sp. SHJSY1]|uniref:DUF421 domain-containing protein n=1 Tax=Clostridium sp. SHJSY1 TaxID=2942483 RepID=UPI002876A662|nr:DUF421 domain-containing protein [Clostridium sp. SHJSY1]MDS0528214.1 DUF421 domain-containing protein [Clostridium sp. SHJSY1]